MFGDSHVCANETGVLTMRMWPSIGSLTKGERGIGVKAARPFILAKKSHLEPLTAYFHSSAVFK